MSLSNTEVRVLEAIEELNGACELERYRAHPGSPGGKALIDLHARGLIEIWIGTTRKGADELKKSNS